MNFKQAAIDILKEENKPLHYREITDKAIKKGLISSNGNTPWATMNALLSTDIANYGKDSYFQRTNPGYYIVNLKNNMSKRQFVTEVTRTHYDKDDKGNIISIKKSHQFFTSSSLSSKRKGDYSPSM